MYKVRDLKKSLILVLSAASVSLAGCGTLPSASTASLASANGLSTLSASGDNSASASASPTEAGKPQGRGARGKGPGGQAGPGGPGMGGLGLYGPSLDRLTLTDEQKTQIQALQAEAKTFFEAHKPATRDSSAQPDREAAKTAFETAFKSDNFDPSPLNRPTPPAPSDAMLDFEVSQTVKLHDILTAEQRALLAQSPEKPANAPSAMPSPPADLAARESQRLDKLATDLSLSDDQKTQLKAVFDARATARKSEMETRRSEMESERAALSALLTADTIDSAALKALIQTRVAKAPAGDDRLQELVEIHAILTADQRAKFLSLKQDGHGGPGGFGGPGHGGPDGRMGFGGPGGPGGEMGSGGHGGPGGEGGPGQGIPGGAQLSMGHPLFAPGA